MKSLTNPRAALAALSLALLATSSIASAKALRYAGPSPVLTFDPHASTDYMTAGTVLNVYDPLVGRDQNLDLRPALAVSWEATAPDVWRLKLREGVKFTGGQPFTAADAKFSLERANAGGKGMLSQFLVSLKEVRIIDDTTIEIVTKYPDPLMPRWLAAIGMMSKSWAEEHDSVTMTDVSVSSAKFVVRNANGTGAFILDNWDPTSGTIKFKRNAGWWGKAEGNITEATYSPIASGPTRIAALLSKDVDLVISVPLQDAKRIETTSGFHVIERPELRQMVLLMSPANETAADTWDKSGAPLKTNPWANVKVRQAVSIALNRDLLVERIMLGRARTSAIASMPGMDGYQKDMDVAPAYDVERAKKLLAEAGFPDGFRARLRCTNDRYLNDEAVCRAVGGMLARIGIQAEPSPEPWGTFVKDLIALKIDFTLLAAAPNGQTTFDMLYGTWMTRKPPEGPFNWSRWSNPALDDAVKAMQSEFDSGKRTELTRRALEITRDQVSGAFLYQQFVTWGAVSNVETTVRPDNYVVLNAIDFK